MNEEAHAGVMGMNLAESMMRLQMKEESWPMPAVYCFKKTQVFKPIRWSDRLQTYEDPDNASQEAWAACLKDFRTKSPPYKFDKALFDAEKAKKQQQDELRKQLKAAEAAAKIRLQELRNVGKVCEPVLIMDDVADFSILDDWMGQKWGWTIQSALKLSDQLAFCQKNDLLVEWDRPDDWPPIARRCWPKYRLRKRDAALHLTSFFSSRKALKLKYRRLNWLLCLDGTYKSKYRKDATIEKFLGIIRKYTADQEKNGDNLKISYIKKGQIIDGPGASEIAQLKKSLALSRVPEEEEVKNQNSQASIDSDSEGDGN